MTKLVTVTRFVAKDDPGNFVYRDVQPGEQFYVFRGNTYGCVNGAQGIALSEKGAFQGPFFQFPLDAIQEEGNYNA